ncbi:hypothetical protein FHS48_003955 [Novispirillum itersonii]|uniref:Uncharacterized protein n=1 Tax=Novispirillum itersonii TaxID=189 RepID=A0A7W9ZLP2_NOVIT|nr:hypothetical protein [Novispirillum itersonii]
MVELIHEREVALQARKLTVVLQDAQEDRVKGTYLQRVRIDLRADAV